MNFRMTGLILAKILARILVTISPSTQKTLGRIYTLLR
jgi:hypothetical protein